uniref:Uncharacterized protein n=1 Tax=Branchiostoma floridae TaxID=7739 RepID=C3YUV3_BRAFL|eukprot:XP_002599992.1 hypothetical protein BRAFLDRAFT_74113 [Branchiostoma floridae]
MESLAVLMVQDEYNTSQGEISINPQLGEILKEKSQDTPVFTAVLQATEEDKKDAQRDGVELLLPKLDPSDPRTDPSPDWLTYDHRVKYPHLPAKTVSIVGHAGVTSRAAVRIKQERYPDTRVILFTSDIPEDTEYYKGDEEAMAIGKKEDSILQDAQEADVVFSLGNTIFDHFETQFKAIPASKRPQHFKFVQRPSKVFEKAQAEYKKAETMVVLSIGRVKGFEKLKGYDLAVESLSIVADKMKVRYRVIGVDKDDFKTSKAILEHCKSSNLQITLLPYGTQKDICKEMMQAHLVLMPSRAEPFGLVGLEAIAAGVPVLVSSKSGLADFIHEHVDELHHSIVDMDEGTSARHWAHCIERVLKHNETEFETAARCRQKLLSSEYWEESHQQFIQACTDTDQKIKLSVRSRSTLTQGKAILRDRLHHITEEQSETVFDETIERYKQLKAEVIVVDNTCTLSEEGKTDLLSTIDKMFTIAVLKDEERFRQTMKKYHKVEPEILELYEACVLCELRFYHRKSQVEFVTACRDGTLSAILTEEYISQEWVQMCGGMPLYVHIEVDEADFQRGSEFFHEDNYPDNHDQSPFLCTVDQTSTITAEIQQMELQDRPSPIQGQADSDDQQTEVPSEISELASLDIRELEQLMVQPRKRTFSMSSLSSGYQTGLGTPGSGPSRPDSPTGEHGIHFRLQALKAELNTPAVKEDKVKQFDLYCEIGDLYRTKLHNLQEAAKQYYQNMLECAQELPEDTKQAKAYSRLGLTCDMLGLQQEALKNHERALAIYRGEAGNETDVCVAYKNIASSLVLSGQVSDAKTNYELALAIAMETGNKTEQMDIYCKLGDLHREQLQEPKASHKYYNEMLVLARDLGKRDREGLAYNRLGLACEDMEDYEAALKWFTKDLELSRDAEDKKELRKAHTNVGNMCRLLGKLEQATSHFNTALQMAQETGDQHGQMKVYFGMGEMNRAQWPDTAIHYYGKYLAQAKQLNDRYEERVAYNRLGHVHYQMGEYEKALDWYQKNLKMCQESGDKKAATTANICLGETYRLLGKLDLATSHFNTALQMAQQTEDQHGQREVYMKMCDMYRQQLSTPSIMEDKALQLDLNCKIGDLFRTKLNNLQSALHYYQNMLKCSQELSEDTKQAMAYNRLGLTYNKLGLTTKAFLNHERALTIFKNLASSSTLSGRVSDAKTNYQLALDVAKETGNKTEEMDIYCKLGNLFIRREQLNEQHTAIRYYNQHLSLARQLGEKHEERAAYNRLGHAHYDIKEYKEALKWYQRHLKMSHENGDKKEQITAHRNVADSYKALGKLERARFHYTMTIAMETGNKTEQMDIFLKLGDLHREQLHEPQVSHKYYTEMLALARDLGRKDRERQAYNRLGMAFWDMQDYEAALEWHQKNLKMSTRKWRQD